MSRPALLARHVLGGRKHDGLHLWASGLPAPQNTALAFRVPADGFEDFVEGVRAQGVTFEEYDLPEVGLKTVRGIAELNGRKRAWFKDPESNIIGLVST